MKWLIVFVGICMAAGLRADVPATTSSDAEAEAQLDAQEERIRKALEGAEFRKLHDHLLGGALPKVELQSASATPAVRLSALVPPREVNVAGDWTAFVRGEMSRVDKMIWNRLYNIENAGTVCFKEVVYEFAASLPTFHQGSDRVARRVTTPNAGEVPVRLVMQQGELLHTSRELDLAISGNAFVVVTDSRTGEPFFTRGGQLEINAGSELAVATPCLGENGWGMSLEPLEPPIVLPPEHKRLVVSMRGQVWSLDASSNETMLGRLPLVTFRDATRLAPRGGGLYAATAASGSSEPLTFDAIQSAPRVEVRQGFLEQSNVDLERERNNLEYLHDLRREYQRLLRSGERPAEEM